MNMYPITLDTLITSYKDDITLFMNSSEKLNDFIEKIDELIKTQKDYFPDYLDYLDYLYFKKSYISLFFPFQCYTTFTYTPYIGGLLLGNSSNCKFTIATININGNETKLFNKIVDYSKQKKNGGQDLLIFDILSATIFDYILSLPEYLKYKDFIAKYRGSFLSYSHKVNNKDYWNFNDLLHRSNKSLYKPSNFQNVKTSIKVIVATYDAINNPITITEIFESDNLEIIKDVIDNCCDIYDFLRDIGLNFGFMHNDLHMSNLLYNPDTRKIIVIDFGRASFAKFMVDDINDIDKKIIVDFEKLNYNKTFNIDLSSITKKGGNSNISETQGETQGETYYESLKTPQQTEQQLPQTYYSSISSTEDKTIEGLFINFLYKNRDFFRKKYSPSVNGKFFGIIFDLITYSLNIYIRFLYFMKKTYTIKDYNEFYDNFKKIIEINYNNNIANLVNNNVTIKTNCSDEDELLSNYEKIKIDYINKFSEGTREKRIYTMLLEGLFYTGLLILFNLKKNREGYFYTYFQVLNTIDELEEFKDFVIEFINKKYENIKFDSFLSNFFTIRTGGLIPQIIGINKDSRFSKIDSLLPSEKHSIGKYSLLFIKESLSSQTVKAYEKIYKDYDNYRAPDDSDSFSIKKGGYKKRILKKYNYYR